jgi:aldehyde:ferredoxin oxidoreductase
MGKRILRINMTTLTATYEDVPEKWERWAGRALTSAIVFDEVDPHCHPLGPHNKLVIAPGWVTGSPAAPSSGRTSFGGKSPSPAVLKNPMPAAFRDSILPSSAWLPSSSRATPRRANGTT